MSGISLKCMRKAQGISQDRLREGICSRSSLRIYKDGKCDPEKLCMDALLQRLGKTVDKYYIQLSEKEYILAKQRIWIQVCLKRGKLKAAEKSIYQYSAMPGTAEKLYRQFIAFVQAELLRRQKAPLEKQQKMTFSGLAETIEEKEYLPKLLEKRVFHLLELFLLQRYAILLEDIGKEADAMCWYKALLKRFEQEKREIADKQKLYPLIAWRFADCLIKKEQFAQALPIVIQALTLLRYSKIQNMLYILLREQQFLIQEKMGNSVMEQEKKFVHRLKEILCRKNGKLEENYYPIYIESHIYSVNEMIRERREMQNKTRESLVGLVCDVRTLEREEKNGMKPQRKTWKGLREELGLSCQKYDGGIVTEEYEDYKILEEMLQAYDKRETDKAMILYERLRGKLDMKELTNRQFEKYWSIELRFEKGLISCEERNQQLWKMMSWTLSLKNKEKSFLCWLTKYEREAFDTITWDCEEKEIEEILPLLKKQFFRNLNLTEQIMEIGFYDKVLYSIARGYLRSGNLQRAEQYITLAIKQRKFRDWGLSWDRLFFLRFQIEEKKFGLWTKKVPPEDETAFQWARLAWAFAKENNDTSMCDFIIGYFQRHYSSKEKYLD